MTAVMPEPPDRAIVGLFDPTGQDLTLVFVRDDTEDATHGDDHWLSTTHTVARTWFGLVSAAAETGREVVRLYRADDPAVTDAFRAGVEAAANAIEKHAESIGWYESSGVWADAIEEARKAVQP